jgi:hypothetical protein
MSFSATDFPYSRIHTPGLTRPARPFRCAALALLHQPSVNFASCVRASKVIRFTRPESTTCVTSGIVTEVSATFVASTTFRVPFGAGGERAALLLGRQLAVQRDDVDVPHVPQLTFRERNLRGAGEEDQNRRDFRADFLLSNFLDDGAETVVVDFEPVTVPFTARRPAYRSTTAPRTALR